MNRTYTNSTSTSPSGQHMAFWVVTANSENLILQESCSLPPNLSRLLLHYTILVISADEPSCPLELAETLEFS